MSTTTTNYSLIKPELTDAADITAMNANWDALDAKLKEISDNASDPSIVAGKVDKAGDTLTGSLTFENKDAYHALMKYRTITGTTYGVNVGCGVLGGQGIVALEVRQGDTTDSPMLARFEIGDRGVSYVDSEGKRTYLITSEVSIATVE